MPSRAASPEVSLPSILEFDPKKLGPHMNDLAHENHDILRDRGIQVGHLEFMPTSDAATRAVARAQTAVRDKTLGVYVPMAPESSGEAKDALGLAIIRPGAKLKRLVPVLGAHLPPVASRLLSLRYSFANPNIKAWVDLGQDRFLQATYAGAVALAQENGWGPYPWTTEPVGDWSSDVAHAAIQASGMDYVGGPALFDDQQNAWVAPPESRLYAVTSGERPSERTQILRVGSTGPDYPVPPMPPGMLG